MIRIDERAMELDPKDLIEWLEQQNNGDLRCEIGLESLRRIVHGKSLSNKEWNTAYEEGYSQGYSDGVVDAENEEPRGAEA